MRLLVNIQLVLMSLSVPFNLWSQACCSGGVPIGGTLGLGTAENKSLQFLATYDYNAIHDLMNVSERLKDDTRKRNTQSVLLETNYGIGRKFALTALFPFIRQERRIKSFGGSVDFTISQGLGDVVFLLKYRLLNTDKQPNWDWVIGAGPKLPTGKTTFTNNDGLALVSDLQPGTGSIDGIFWMYLQRSNFMFPNLSILSITTFRLTGKNKRYNQSQVYEFGDEFQTNLGISYRFYAKKVMDVFSYIRYRSQTEDLIDGSPFPSSGGKWVYVIPGININFSPDFSIRFSGDIPAYRKLEGTQLTTSYRASIAVFYKLKKKNQNSISDNNSILP